MITIYQPKLWEDLQQIKQLHLILAIFGVRYICTISWKFSSYISLKSKNKTKSKMDSRFLFEDINSKSSKSPLFCCETTRQW